MIFQVKINGQTVAFKDGVNFEEHYNERLDTATLVLSQVQELDIEPFDEVVVLGTDFTKRYLIASIGSSVSQFDEPMLYNYDLGLVSATIKMQRIVLPNRTITHSKVGMPSKSLVMVMNNFLEIYAPNLTLGAEVNSFFSGIRCPEFTWQRPTLFEVFNDLMSVKNCVVTIRNFNVVSFLDLNMRGDDIDMTKLNNIEENTTAEEYASHLEMEAQNVIGRPSNTKTIEYVAPSTTKDAILATDNLEVVLQKPIQFIDKVVVKFSFFDTELSLDITDYIVEKTKWDLKKTSNQQSFVYDMDLKRNFLYFTEGDNKIVNLGWKESTWTPFTDAMPSLNNVFRMAMEGGSYTYLEQEVAGVVTGTNMYDVLFYVEYTALDTVKFLSEKQSDYKHRSTLIDNQTSSFVDITALGKQQQNTINRLGNKLKYIYGIYKNYSEVPKLGDKLPNDYTLSSRKYAIHQDYIVFSGEITQHFVRTNMYTALNSRKRYTQIASASDSFLSNHILKTRLTFTFDRDFYHPIVNQLSTYLVQIGISNQNVRLAVAQFTYSNNTTSDLFGFEVSAYAIGNSLVTTFRAKDNFEVGIQVDKFSSWWGGTTYPINFVNYVDFKGEFDRVHYRLLTEFENDTGSTTHEYLDAVEVARNYPILPASAMNAPYAYASLMLPRYKDNREIFSETTQFMFNAEDNIYPQEAFYNFNVLLYNESADLDLFIAVSYDDFVNGTEIVKPSGHIVTGWKPQFIENSITPEYSGWGTQINWDEVQSWMIVDHGNNVYLSVNGNQRPVYLIEQDLIYIVFDDVEASGSVDMIFHSQPHHYISLLSEASASVDMIFHSQPHHYISLLSEATMEASARILQTEFIELSAEATGIAFSWSGQTEFIKLLAETVGEGKAEHWYIFNHLIDLASSAQASASAEMMSIQNHLITLSASGKGQPSLSGSYTLNDPPVEPLETDIELDGIGKGQGVAVLNPQIEMEWVEGGNLTQANNTPDVCESWYDKDNVRQIVLGTNTYYTFVNVGEGWFTNQNESVSGVCNNSGDVGNTRVVCAPDFESGLWYCQEQECTEVTTTTYGYEKCQVKE